MGRVGRDTRSLEMAFPCFQGGMQSRDGPSLCLSPIQHHLPQEARKCKDGILSPGAHASWHLVPYIQSCHATVLTDDHQASNAQHEKRPGVLDNMDTRGGVNYIRCQRPDILYPQVVYQVSTHSPTRRRYEKSTFSPRRNTPAIISAQKLVSHPDPLQIGNVSTHVPRPEKFHSRAQSPTRDRSPSCNRTIRPSYTRQFVMCGSRITATPLQAHTPAAATWVSLPIEMGLRERTTANVLRYAVASFVLEPRPFLERPHNELLEGPKIPIWEQLRTKYNIPVRHNVPFPTSTARSLEFEPTKIRAEIQGQVGHTCEVAMLAAQRLEHAVFQWHVETDEYSVTFLCGQGFFAGHALSKPELVTDFLVDPVRVCNNEFLFDGTHVQEVLAQGGEPQIKPNRFPIGILFSKIYRILEPAVRDTSWSPVRRAAFEFLTDFAQGGTGVGSHFGVRRDPVRTMLACAYFSVLMSLEDSAACSVLVLSKSHPGASNSLNFDAPKQSLEQGASQDTPFQSSSQLRVRF